MISFITCHNSLTSRSIKSCWSWRLSVTSSNFRGWNWSSVMSCTDTMLRTVNNSVCLFCFTELYKMRSRRRRSLHLPPKISVRCDDSEWAFTALRNKRKAEHKPTRACFPSVWETVCIRCCPSRPLTTEQRPQPHVLKRDKVSCVLGFIRESRPCPICVTLCDSTWHDSATTVVKNKTKGKCCLWRLSSSTAKKTQGEEAADRNGCI